jgi:hypothetical protein
MKDMDGAGWSFVPPPAEPEPELEPQTFDDWLQALGLADKKDALGELLAPGKELMELEQMDADDLETDILMDPDLALTGEEKAEARKAIKELSSAAEDPPDTSESSSSDSAWHELCHSLGVESGDLSHVEDERLLRRKELSSESMGEVEALLASQKKQQRKRPK